MNIFLIPQHTAQNVLAKKILDSHHCKNLFIQNSHAFANSIGTTVSININDFSEVAAFCIASKINVVVINNVELLQKGLFNFLQDEQQEWKGIVTGCTMHFFDEPFAANFCTKSIYTLISDGKKYFSLTDRKLDEHKEYLDRLMQNLTENNYTFNGFLEVFIGDDNGIKYYPSIIDDTILEAIETDLLSVFVAAYNGTFEDVNL